MAFWELDVCHHELRIIKEKGFVGGGQVLSKLRWGHWRTNDKLISPPHTHTHLGRKWFWGGEGCGKVLWECRNLPSSQLGHAGCLPMNKHQTMHPHEKKGGTSGLQIILLVSEVMLAANPSPLLQADTATHWNIHQAELATMKTSTNNCKVIC